MSSCVFAYLQLADTAVVAWDLKIYPNENVVNCHPAYVDPRVMMFVLAKF